MGVNRTAMVQDFHRAFGLRVGTTSPTDTEQLMFRFRLMAEELVEEYVDAVADKDAEGILDALVDLAYLVEGTAIELGYDMDEAFDRVHEANMAKLGPDGKPILRDDGKVVKPDGWQAPDLSDLVT